MRHPIPYLDKESRTMMKAPMVVRTGAIRGGLEIHPCFDTEESRRSFMVRVKTCKGLLGFRVQDLGFRF